MTRDEAAVARLRSVIEQIEAGKVSVVEWHDTKTGFAVATEARKVTAPSGPARCEVGTEGCAGRAADLRILAGVPRCYVCDKSPNVEPS